MRHTMDVTPQAERRLDIESTRLYGPSATLSDVSETWRPLRSWAAVHLRARRHEMS
ncbi:hypothetical protein ABZ942_41165 [Nocardia sp. NPDC046473]|uniref:hypothetical protein n=1 Tax=Nocardia sp. NPDC046473 TaxID=3155733 RepID=UPI003403E2F7